jgi:hypothetical protein
MKKTIIAILLAGTSVTALAGDRFSNDFFRVNKSQYELSSGSEVNELSVTTSVSLNEMFFVEAHFKKSELNYYNIKEVTYGGYVGAEFPLQINLNSVFYLKAGALKTKTETDDIEDDIEDDIKDVQAGFRWDYGLPRLDIKLFVGRKDYKEIDDQHTYYGADINYFLTKNFSIGGGMIKNEDTKAEEISFNAAFHW